MSKILTPLELKVMNILWKKKKAFVKDVLESWDEDPKPAYNTISTTVRILQEKEFVGHEAFGRSHKYYPLVSKFKYQKNFLHNALDSVFSGDPSTLVSALLDEGKISETEINELKDLIKNS